MDTDTNNRVRMEAMVGRGKETTGIKEKERGHNTRKWRQMIHRQLTQDNVRYDTRKHIRSSTTYKNKPIRTHVYTPTPIHIWEYTHTTPTKKHSTIEHHLYPPTHARTMGTLHTTTTRIARDSRVAHHRQTHRKCEVEFILRRALACDAKAEHELSEVDRP